MEATWTLQDAKNRFSAVVDAAARGEPQMVTRRGKWVSVVLSAAGRRGLRADAAHAQGVPVFLIDTMVLSELRLRRRDPGVVAWIGSQRPEDCFLSVVSIGEIERGIARKRTSDAGFAQQLAGWLDQLLRLYGDRLLPVDVGVARRWGQLSADIGHDGADLLIAATALERGLTVVTRNLRHFTPTGVAIINPWHEELGC